MATTEELVEYYANLLILQYVNQAKARAHIETLVTPVIMDQVPVAVQDAFDLETAEGVNLDTLAKYVGVTRHGYANDAPVTLDDDDFRTLIKMVIIKNTGGSSLYDIQSLLAANFPNQITVSDSTNMGLNYVIAESLGTDDLLEILENGGYLPAPMGVSVSVVIVPSLDTHYFGFRTYSAPDSTVSPFNSYSLYQLTWPWLSYSGVS